MARPFRLRAPDPYELDIHASCAQTLDAILCEPALWCCYPAGAVHLSPQQQARYSKLGLKRGFPDLLVFYNGCWGIEIKRRTGKLTKTRIVRTRRGSPRVLVGQEEMFPKLIVSGGFRAIGIIHDVYEMIEQLANWQMPLRPGPYLEMKNLRVVEPLAAEERSRP